MSNPNRSPSPADVPELRAALPAERWAGDLGTTTQWCGRRAVVEAGGEIDMATIAQLEAAVGAALDEGALELWVDLTTVAFMDSSGINALLALRRRAADLNRRLAIVCGDGLVRRTLEIAGVDRVLPLFETRAAAHRGA